MTEKTNFTFSPELKSGGSFPAPLFEQNIIGQNDPGEVMKAARDTVGITPAELTLLLVTYDYEMSVDEYLRLENNQDEPSADFWVHFCRLLHLPFDSYYGYSRWWHLAMIQVALQYGECRFPKRISLTDAIAEYQVAREAHAKQIQSRYDAYFFPSVPSLPVASAPNQNRRSEHGVEPGLKTVVSDESKARSEMRSRKYRVRERKLLTPQVEDHARSMNDER